MERNKTKDLVLMAFYVALFIVLDLIVNAIPFLQMPNGGSWGLSTVPLLLASYHLGWKRGTLVCVVAVFLMFVTGPMYTPDLLGFALDYFFAFSVYGLASLFPNIKSIFTGVFVSNALRFVLHTIAGVVVWGVDLRGSIAYQAYYMIPTLILGMILVPIMYKSLEPLMKK